MLSTSGTWWHGVHWPLQTTRRAPGQADTALSAHHTEVCGPHGAVTRRSCTRGAYPRTIGIAAPRLRRHPGERRALRVPLRVGPGRREERQEHHDPQDTEREAIAAGRIKE